jgi:hypothetical protein
MAEQQNRDESALLEHAPAVGTWVVVLAALAAVVMGTQLRFPWAGGRIGLADVALGLAFLALLADQFRRGVRYPYPRVLAAALGLYVVASLLARPGASGAVEVVQRFEQLFCGYLVWALLLRERRTWVVALVTAMLAASVLWAAIQARSYGFASVLPPADVMALSWGVGGAYTGLFRSRVALSLFLGAGLVLVQPAWHTWAVGCRWRRVAVVLGSAAVLAMIPHGFVLLAAAIALLAAGLLAGGGNAWRNGVAVALTALALLASGRVSTVAATLSPAQPGSAELKSCHVDFLAALRMASQRPWTGVGAGSYQKYIGRCYGELPNPNVNDVETDTQSGLGILLGTSGYPAGLLLLLAMLALAVRALAAFLSGNRSEPLLLGAASALPVFLVCLLVTDPFVRGPVWYLALALAAAVVPSPGTTGTLVLGWVRVVLAGAVVTGCAALVLALPTADALARRPTASRSQAAGKAARPSAVSTQGKAQAQSSGSAAAAASSLDLFRVLNAAEDAKVVTPPFEKAPDSQSANGTILRIEDGKGTPPEGEESDMKYGGATYEVQLAAPVTCKIWIRAWWEGSCGNTVCFRVGEEGKILTVGNDGTYDAWHWLEVPTTFSLDKGTHTLYLLNREDGIRIDQILVTNDMEYYPQGAEEE